MEQRLDATFLRTGPFERAAAVALAAAGVGVGVFLGAWGVSFFWRYTPPEIAVHVSNPEVRIVQDGPFMIEFGQITVKMEQPLSPQINARLGTDAKPAAGDVISREVTVFSHVRHGLGTVVTGWNYKDGSGGMPVSQFCYYTSDNPDGSSKRVDLAIDSTRRPQISTDLVPDLESVGCGTDN
jgi:hypothetical protein